MKNSYIYFAIGIIAAALIVFGAHRLSQISSPQPSPQTDANVIKVVAAENFYGDIVRQLGGNHVNVLSILSDPNADPHQYEPSVQDAIAIAKANIVIENGDGYDTWMEKLLSASPNERRIVLVGTNIADHKLPDNSHVWYGFDNVHTIAAKITAILKQEDPSDAIEFDQNLAVFDNSLQPLEQKIGEIKATYNGTPVALTEPIYLYQTQAEGLDVLTPYAFEKMIAQGNDPSVDDVARANDQISNKQVKILIYNKQTVTPITTNLQNDAKSKGIPLVAVTETMPRGKHYQDWMMSQLTELENALQSSK